MPRSNKDGKLDSSSLTKEEITALKAVARYKNEKCHYLRKFR